MTGLCSPHRLRTTGANMSGARLHYNGQYLTIEPENDRGYVVVGYFVNRGCTIERDGNRFLVAATYRDVDTGISALAAILEWVPEEVSRLTQIGLEADVPQSPPDVIDQAEAIVSAAWTVDEPETLPELQPVMINDYH